MALNELHSLISIVVPVYNEEGNLELLHSRIRKTFEDLDCDWELILVDDGSHDDSAAVMRRLHEADSRVKALFFSRNFGQDAALTAGLDKASGDATVIIDADLQDPPELIGEMIEKWREGYDIIAAQRLERQGETRLKKAASFLFYRLMNSMVQWEFQKDTGDFRLMDRKVVDAFRQCPQYNRFVRSLIAWTGFRVTTIGYERASRHAGDTEYTFWQSLSLAITSITNFSVVPLRMAIWLGFGMVTLSAMIMVFFIVAKFMGKIEIAGMTTIALSLWFLGGIQCMLLGVVGEYVGRTYVESQRRPLYIVRESLGGTLPDVHAESNQR
jgi:dolichol-phosphate mannosyltransferase